VTNALLNKPARKHRRVQFEMPPAIQARVAKAMTQVGEIADKQARKDDQIQREARVAIAETFDAWFDWAEDEAPKEADAVFFQLACCATAGNRRRMFKHANAPEGIEARVQKQLDSWKADDKTSDKSTQQRNEAQA
jgi:hypothetical protein